VSRLLLVEDNRDLAFGLRNNLEIEGYEVEVASDGKDGLERARRSRPDLVILDLMLPGLDGFRLLKALRQDGLAMPVLILTARGEEADKVRGLKLGADDYVTKPFGVLELLARVEALLRRGRTPAEIGEPPRTERFGDVTVDPGTRTVTRGGQAVELAPKEFDLLLALLQRQGAVVARLAELRRKLEADPAAPRHILTVRKIGYRLRS
jgi:two-component system alkaline phosphatase synthesis response regulator PhoP